MLIFTDDPDVFRGFRALFEATTERVGASGRRYDEGSLATPRVVWKAMLAVDVDDAASFELGVRDWMPTLLVVVTETYTIETGVVAPDRLVPARGKRSGQVLNASQTVQRLLRRVLLRGEWPAGDMQINFRVVTYWETADPLLLSAMRVTQDVPCNAVYLLTPPQHGHPDDEVYELAVAILRNIDPSELREQRLPAKSIDAVSLKGDRIPVQGAVGHVAMRSLRMFEELTWSAPETTAGWHVLLGDNASGKTSVLRAIALCLLDRSEREALRQSWSSWLRNGTNEGAVTVTLHGNDGDTSPTALSLDLRRVAATKPGDAPSVDVMSAERLVHAGFLAAYGPFRRFTGGDAEWVKGFKDHPRLQRVLTLFDERAALSDAIEWLKDLWVRAKTITPTPPEADFLRDLLAFINETEFLPDGVVVEEPDADGVWCRDGNGLRVPVIDLSDGYRSVLSLALDLLRHLAAEYGHARVFERDPEMCVAVRGVVLIDEVDAHLHPRWQQRIGAWFKRRFPKVQFITATHSAIVCQSADSVLLLPTPGGDDAPRMATPDELNRLRYGNLLDAFGTGVFGRGVEQSPEGRARLERLAALNLKELDEGLSEEEETERAALRATLPSRAGVMRGRG